MSLAIKRKKRRIMMLVFGGIALAISAVLVSLANRDLITFYFGPAEMVTRAEAGEFTETRRLRLGGMVENGSLVRGQGESITFTVVDGQGALEVAYTGVLPDLFEEGQGVVAEGYYRDGRFEAEEILAKHDENYMPREVAESLKESGYALPGQEAAQ